MVDWIRSYNARSSGRHCVPEASVASDTLGRHCRSFARRCGTHVGWFSDSHRYATDDFYVLVLTLCPTAREAAQTRGMDACWRDICDSMLDGHHGLS